MDTAYESAILEGFFTTWQSVQRDIETTLRTGVNLHALIVDRWFEYLDHVDRIVQRAKTVEPRAALDEAHASAIAQGRKLDTSIPAVAHDTTTQVSQVGGNLTEMPHKVASDIMLTLTQAPSLRDRGTTGAVGFHKATVNAATPILSRAMVASRTEIERRNRDAVRAWLRDNPRTFRGWWWASSLSPDDCVACWVMHGSGHGLEDDLNDHPNGNCKVMPWLHHESLPTSGEERFAELNDSEQARILGATRTAMYRSGAVTLPGMVTVDRDPQWGESVGTTPIRMLDKAQAGG